MSAVFPGIDFVSANWRGMATVAAPYPDALPDCGVVDFDGVKNQLCAYRGYRYCSVDALVVGRDGRFYFIEFKDTTDNPIAWLRKKAFDSLLVFGLTVGHALSMEEIRRRAVFIYVTPDGTHMADSDKLGVIFEESAGEAPPDPLPYQLANLRATGLYSDVKSFETAQFLAFIGSIGDFSADEIKTGAFVTCQLALTCHPCVSCSSLTSRDLKTCVEPLLSLRMDRPFDELTNRRDQLMLADSFTAQTKCVGLHHDWAVGYPIMTLATTAFDSFVICAVAFDPGRSMDDSADAMTLASSFEGVPPLFTRPSHAFQYVYDFYDAYSPKWPVKYGLDLFRDIGFYAVVQ